MAFTAFDDIGFNKELNCTFGMANDRSSDIALILLIITQAEKGADANLETLLQLLEAPRQYEMRQTKSTMVYEDMGTGKIIRQDSMITT